MTVSRWDDWYDDWCAECGPVHIIDESQEVIVRSIHGTGDTVHVLHYSCGHNLTIG